MSLGRRFGIDAGGQAVPEGGGDDREPRFSGSMKFIQLGFGLRTESLPGDTHNVFRDYPESKAAWQCIDDGCPQSEPGAIDVLAEYDVSWSKDCGKQAPRQPGLATSLVRWFTERECDPCLWMELRMLDCLTEVVRRARWRCPAPDVLVDVAIPPGREESGLRYRGLRPGRCKNRSRQSRRMLETALGFRWR